MGRTPLHRNAPMTCSGRQEPENGDGRRSRKGPTVTTDHDHDVHETAHDATVRSTLVIERADGSRLEVVWDDTGRVANRRIDADGTVVDEVQTFDRDGAFVVGHEPVRIEQERDLYGSLTERATYDDGSCIEQRWDADVRLRHVRVEGLWGSQTMELWPDGSRALRWNLARLHGTRRWDATGAGESLVEFGPDGSGSGGPTS